VEARAKKRRKIVSKSNAMDAFFKLDTTQLP